MSIDIIDAKQDKLEKDINGNIYLVNTMIDQKNKK